MKSKKKSSMPKEVRVEVKQEAKMQKPELRKGSGKLKVKKQR